MTEPLSAAGPPRAGRALSLLNAVLAVALVAVVIWLVLVLALGAKAWPFGSSHADKVASRYDAVRAAATSEIKAFLTLDYKNMDPVLKRVLNGGTGKFRRQYSSGRVGLKTSAQAAHTVSHGRIRSVGVSELGPNSAVVFVAADALVRNSRTAKQKPTSSCPHSGEVCRFYRLKVSMKLTGAGWKMADLEPMS